MKHILLILVLSFPGCSEIHNDNCLPGKKLCSDLNLNVMSYCGTDQKWITVRREDGALCVNNDFKDRCEIPCEEGDRQKYVEQDWVCRYGEACDNPYYQPKE